MTTLRHTRIQAAVVLDDAVLVVQVLLDDGRRFWLLPGGGREPADVDDEAVIVREIREETFLDVTVDRVLLERDAGADDESYRHYRTFLCRPKSGSAPRPGARDGTAEICGVRWLPLVEEESWGPAIRTDCYLYPQLMEIRSALQQYADGSLP